MMFLTLALSLLIAPCFADVIHLTDETEFNKLVAETNVLAEFYAPWCGHCKNLAPEYEIAGKAFKAEDPVALVAVDATVATFSGKYDVKGYPTLKWFPKGKPVQEYGGGRTADTIVPWVNEQIGTNRKIKMAPTAVMTLTMENFQEVTTSGRGVLVEFYAPWCGHCKQLTPIYEELAKVFEGDSKSVVIAKVDATAENEIGEMHKIEGFPTIKWFPPSSGTPMDYPGGRQLEDMVDFINSQLPSLQRSYDGGLKPTAGRYAAFDAMLFEAGYDINQELLTSFNTIVAGLKGDDLVIAKVYTKILEKIIEKGPDYIDTESARVRKLSSSEKLKAADKTKFLLKLNALKAFSADTSTQIS